MIVPDDSRIESLRRLFEQHWLHCRHLESERAWFMSVYAAIAGSMLIYIFKENIRELWPIYFLMFLTLVGFLLNVRWIQVFEEHRERVNTIIEHIGLKTIVDSKSKTVDLTMDIPDILPNRFFKILRIRYLFPSFYAVVFVGLIILVITKPFRD